MNYRHAFHAGNFADVVKHLIVARVLAYMQRKDAGLVMIDTHAGIGRYDLGSNQAKRTGEAENGIVAFMKAKDNAPKPIKVLIAPYCEVIERFNPNGGLKTYPGSPRIMHAMRRRQDRLSLMELHDADYAALAREFAGAHGVKARKLDGWVALKAQLPPKERRGLILIDPPYEAQGEFDAVMDGLSDALKRFATGTYCVWYPLKHQSATEAFESNLRALGTDLLLTAVYTGSPASADGKSILHGSGMAVINPPYILESELRTLLPWLASVLEREPGRGGWNVEAIAP